MTRTQAPESRTTAPSRGFRVRTATAVCTVSLFACIALPAHAVSLPQREEGAATPIAGDVVTCVVNGETLTLTGASGSMVKSETTRIDHQGRARVLFTVRAQDAVLLDEAGAAYQLTGRGYDRVVYPSAKITGEPLRESIRYRFDVTTSSGRVGVVRFSLKSVSGKEPRIADTSTCKIPEG